MPDERDLVHSFDRSATEQVQVSLSKYKGKTYADIRIYYKADGGEYRPTKKGITVSPAQLPELGEAIRKLMEKVAGSEQREWRENGDVHKIISFLYPRTPVFTSQGDVRDLLPFFLNLPTTSLNFDSLAHLGS